MSVDRNRLELWRLRDSLDRRHRTGIETIELEIALRGGRGAPGAMQGKRIAGGRVQRERGIPGNKLRCADEIKRCRCQSRHVQRLANMTRWVRTLRVLVKEAAACREIQQRGAGQYRQRALRRRSSENGFPRVHKRHFSLAPWTGGEASWLQ